LPSVVLRNFSRRRASDFSTYPSYPTNVIGRRFFVEVTLRCSCSISRRFRLEVEPV